MNNVFGPYAGYTCCTANMHQGWTKFTTHLWYATPDRGLAALEYAPNTVKANVADGTEVTIQETTQYPFEDAVTFRITASKAVTFPLALRIPGWCKEATVLLNGQKLQTAKGGQVIKLKRTYQSGDQLTLQLPAEVTTSNWARNSRTIERGPLVFALKVDAEVTKKEHPKEGTYYEYTPKNDWNYGLPKSLIDNPAGNTRVAIKPVPADQLVWNPDRAPIVITTVGRKIPAWKVVEGVARQPVTTREGVYQGEVDQKSESLQFIPYGCTKLRVVALPVVK